MEENQTNTWILVLPSIVALLAVVISWWSLTIANRQMRASVKTADKQITAPMRQAWIDKLRELLAKLTSGSTHYGLTGTDGLPDEEGTALLLLLDHIRLMLNPKEDDHQRLAKLLHEMVGNIGSTPANKDEFLEIREKVLNLSQTVLKREWNRVKKPMVAEPGLVWPAWANKLWSKKP